MPTEKGASDQGWSVITTTRRGAPSLRARRSASHSRGRMLRSQAQHEQARTEERVHAPLKVLSYVIAALMAVAVAYAAYISVAYWSGIGV